MENQIWIIISSLSTAIAAIGAIVAAFIAYYAFSQSTKVLQQQLASDRPMFDSERPKLQKNSSSEQLAITCVLKNIGKRIACDFRLRGTYFANLQSVDLFYKKMGFSTPILPSTNRMIVDQGIIDILKSPHYYIIDIKYSDELTAICYYQRFYYKWMLFTENIDSGQYVEPDYTEKSIIDKLILNKLVVKDAIL